MLNNSKTKYQVRIDFVEESAHINYFMRYIITKACQLFLTGIWLK